MTVHVAELYSEHVSVAFQHELLSILQERELRPTVESFYSVVSVKHGDDNSGYIVARVSHLTEPFQEADVAVDRRETYLCACDGFYFHCFDADAGAKVGDCKHIKKVKRGVRGEHEQQVTLDMGGADE